jgi:hypothetical protein
MLSSVDIGFLTMGLEMSVLHVRCLPWARSFCILGLILGLIDTTAAYAQSAHTGCRTTLPAESEIAFAHPKHRQWYNRFWGGSCDGLSVLDFCQPGRPYWNEVVERLGREASETRRGQTVAEACRVGHLIGLEWAKDNDKRCIHTKDLPALYAQIDAGGAPLVRLQRTERAAKALLRCRR